MKRLLNYLPLHFVVLGVSGICFQFFTQFWKYGFLNLFLVLTFSLLFFLIKNRVVITITSLWLFFFTGISSVYISDDRNYDDYYKNHFKEQSSVVLQIHKILKPGNYYQKYQANVISVDDKDTRGTILLNVLKDSLSNLLKVDDKIILKPTFKKLIPPLNPHQFDYRSYLAIQGIHHQVFIEKHQFFKKETQQSSLYGWSAKLRAEIQKSLANYNFKKDELAVINALLLGQRQDISKSLISDYQNAGAIHILAVSGLHVGVILLILSFVFKPLEKVRNGKVLKTVIIVLLLWVFAFIAGLSASVVRAVTMFSFVAFGMSFRRKNIVEFSFISSLFFLLLIKPMFLFDVGFQLSYLAVFGILWTQSKLYSIWKPKYRIIDFFWKLFTVSIAAQVGIFPLSIYYFQQFPGLFLASNLIIIPFLGAILIGGILVIVSSLCSLLPQIIADVYGAIISLMNSFVSWISHQEDFLFKDISISLCMMLLWYIALFTLIYLLIKKTGKQLILFLIAVVFVQSLFLVEKNRTQSKNEFIVFHKSRHSLLGERRGEELLVYHNLDSLQFLRDNTINSYRISEDIQEVKKIHFRNIKQFSKHTILLVDSLGVYKIRNLKKPIVILQYSPKINLERLIKSTQPTQIIADGSNYKSYVIRWEKISLEYQIPFHYTGQQGAFVLKEQSIN